MNPVLSVIVPTYNRDWCIERAIKSVTKQKNTKWELIIVDDGSTDNTQKVILKYLTDKRIKYFYKRNGGVNSARNYGIKKALGNYLVFLDSDDELYTNKALEIIKNDFETSPKKTGVILYPVIIIKNDIMEGNNKFDNKKYEIKPNEYICGTSKATGENLATTKRAMFNNHSFPEYVNGFENILWTKLIRKYNFIYHNIPLRKYYIHNDSLSKEIPNVDRSIKYANAYKEYIKDNKRIWLTNCKSILGKNYLYLSYYFLLSKQRMKSITYLLMSFKYNYVNILSLIILISIPQPRTIIKIINIIKNKIFKIIETINSTTFDKKFNN